MLERVARRLEGPPTVFAEYPTNDDCSHSPRLTVQWDEDALGLSLAEVMTELSLRKGGLR